MNTARPLLNQLNIVSANVAKSIEFYRRLGVEIPDHQVWRTPSGIHHVNTEDHPPRPFRLELDSAAFAPFWNSGWKEHTNLAGRVVIGFGLPSREAVDALYTAMTEAGHPGLQPPWDAFWGARYAVIEDPDGIAVGLMSPAEDGKRSPPPQV